MESDIFDIIENALAMGGYKILNGGGSYVIVRHPSSDSDYRITVEEEP